MKKKPGRSLCPIACTLDILGDRWTMIVIRDLFRGAARYNDFLACKEKITSNILADRLKHLEKENLIKKRPYQNNPVRYEYTLTEKGRDLVPLMTAMIEWAIKWKQEVIPGKLPEKALRSFLNKINNE